MSRSVLQGSNVERSDRQAAARMLARAVENQTRPRTRNKRVVALLQELIDLYNQDALERAGARA